MSKKLWAIQKLSNEFVATGLHPSRFADIVEVVMPSLSYAYPGTDYGIRSVNTHTLTVTLTLALTLTLAVIYLSRYWLWYPLCQYPHLNRDPSPDPSPDPNPRCHMPIQVLIMVSALSTPTH